MQYGKKKYSYLANYYDETMYIIRTEHYFSKTQFVN